MLVPQYSHCQVRVNGEIFTAESIKDDWSVDRDTGYGTSTTPVTETDGQLKLGELELTFELLEANRLEEALFALSLAQVGREAVALGLFTATKTVQFADKTDVTTYNGLRLLKGGSDWKAGPDRLMRDYSCSVQEILRNGKPIM